MQQAAARHVLKVAGKALLVALAFLVLDVGMRVFAVLSLWHVPDWAIGFVVSIIVADLMWGASRLVAGVRKRRRDNADTAHLTEGQRANLRMEQLRTERAAYEQRRSWPGRLRRPRWWITRALDAIYVACFGVVIAAWYSPIVGSAAAILALVMALVLRWLTHRLLPTLLAIAGFFDPTAPKDTPEI